MHVAQKLHCHTCSDILLSSQTTDMDLLLLRVGLVWPRCCLSKQHIVQQLMVIGNPASWLGLM